MNKTLSFTAADSVPIKLLLNDIIIENIRDGRIIPAHLQISPTNKCNLKCGFCSCKHTNREDELDILSLKRLIHTCAELGTQAVTITGGGEPLMYPEINQVIHEFKKNDIETGLVTNGLLLNRLWGTTIDRLTWCRISCSDERKFDSSRLKPILGWYENVDWAFSYVITQDFDSDNLSAYVDFANRHNFSHVRVVSNLIDLDNIPSMETVKTQVQVDDSLVIYQGRGDYSPGAKHCYISLLKPIIASDGKIYPCCGVQYAREINDLDFPPSMTMGSILDIEAIYEEQRTFDGSICKRCYYQGYNDLLGALMSDIKHASFV